MDAIYAIKQEISQAFEDYLSQIRMNGAMLQQKQWEQQQTENWNKRTQAREKLVPPCKSVWKPPDLCAKPSLKEFLLREEFSELPKSKEVAAVKEKSEENGETVVSSVPRRDSLVAREAEQLAEIRERDNSRSVFNGSKSAAKESTNDVEKEGYNSQIETTRDQPTFEQSEYSEDKVIIVLQNERSEIPENHFSQEVHISYNGIGGVVCEAGNNKNEKEITIVEKMDSEDVTYFHAITEMHNDMVKKKNSSCPMSASLLEADAVEVIIQTPTSLEQLKIKCCFDYSKLSNISLDDVNDMEKKNVETMIENEHCSTAPNLVAFKMLKMEGYKGVLYVFDPGGSRQILLIMNYVDHVFTCPCAVIMELSYGVKKLNTSDSSSDEVDHWVGSKFCCFVLRCSLKLRSVVEPLSPYFVGGVYLILVSVDDEGTLNIVGLNSCNGNTISERVYRRAFLVLRNQTSEEVVCLHCYIFYLARGKRKEEEMMGLEGTLGKSDAVNRELISLEGKLSILYKNNGINAFILWVYSLVHKEEGNEILARIVLVEGINGYLWNWSAWHLLQTLCTKVEALSNLHFNFHRRKDLFIAKAYYELPLHKESLKKYEYLQGTFSCGNYIQGRLLKLNIISWSLNKKCLSVWILRIHECVEKKNTSAAIGERQVAVDIIPWDCQAWYGLGQTYAMIFRPFYFLAYWKKSTLLQPCDFCLWIARAHCNEIEQIHMLDEAIRSYKRAANCNNIEAITLHRLAQLHDELGHTKEATFDYKKNWERMKNRTTQTSVNQHISKEVFLWTEVQYSLQEEQQISKQFKLMYMGEDSVVDIGMASYRPSDATIYVDPCRIFVDNSQKWLYVVAKTKIRLIGASKIWAVTVWTSRPPPGSNPIAVGTFEFAGNSIEEKVKELREKLVPEKTYVALTTVLRGLERKLSRGYNKADRRFADEGHAMILRFGVEVLDNEINENVSSISAELISAIINAIFPDESSHPLSGYRIIPHDAKSMMAISFQFPLEANLQNNVAAMTRHSTSEVSFQLIHGWQWLSFYLVLVLMSVCVFFMVHQKNGQPAVVETVAKVKIKNNETKDEKSWFSSYSNADPWGQGSKNGRGNVTTLDFSRR